MWSLSKFILMFLLLVVPSTILLSNPGSSSVLVRAQEDILEEEEIIEDEGEATIENEDDVIEDEAQAVTGGDADDEDEEESKPLKPSPDADTHLLFTKPVGGAELPAGQLVKFVVGFQNKGDKDFTVNSIEASFRYPQDYSYYIQNFSAVAYEQIVEPGQEASFQYSFIPSETFTARPFGLSILMHYKDGESDFMDALFNDTINIIEVEDGLDGETFFLYLLLAAIVVLVVVGIHQALTHTALRKKLPVVKKSKPVIEMGTQNNADVDFDWIPMDHVTGYKSSPRRSPKNSTSPKARRKRNKGQED